jgi:hypothetical protein
MWRMRIVYSDEVMRIVFERRQWRREGAVMLR